MTKLWQRTDLPVENGTAHRTWIWGNSISSWMYEPYEGASTYEVGSYAPLSGKRLVTYYDKGRMESSAQTITNPEPWNVTSGLLVEELMTGKLQLGDATFEQRQPAEVPVAGDPDSAVTPTYAKLAPLTASQPVPNGGVITQTVDAGGSVNADQRFASFGVKALEVGAPTDHTVASVFWDFMNSSGPVMDGVSCGQNSMNCQPVYQDERLFLNPFYATGYPITEAYWAKAAVGGATKDVLLQCFERRCLTYTPDNADGWKVEFGNIGQHYYFWRYGTRPWE